MKALILFLGLLFFQNQPTEKFKLPDYTNWDKVMDHSEPYLYEGKPVDLHDEHYDHISPGNSVESVVVVYYHPEKNTLWFAIYGILHKTPSGILTNVYLFERDNEEWKFTEDLSVNTDLADVFESRYHLEYLRKK